MKSCFSLLLLFFMFSCNKETNTPSNETFPNTVGDHWVYKFSGTNKFPSATDYIYVDVIREALLPDGQKGKVWTYKYSNFVDTTYVVSDASTVKIYNAPCWVCTTQMPGERQRYLLPLVVNNEWFTNAFYGDTTKVLSQLTLSVPAGTFDNTFELSKNVGYVTNSWTNDTIFITPNIGMTKLNQNQYSLGPTYGNGIWELTSYDLK